MLKNKLLPKTLLDKFPKLIAQGVQIHVMCTPYNKPLKDDYQARIRLYNKFLGEPNGKFMTMGKGYYYLLY